MYANVYKIFLGFFEIISVSALRAEYIPRTPLPTSEYRNRDRHILGNSRHIDLHIDVRFGYLNLN